MAVGKSKEKKEYKEGLDWVLKGPVVSEKAVLMGTRGVYVFRVSDDANKVQIKKAIEREYGVLPVSVNVLRRKSKKTRTGRKDEGRKGGGKIAYVYLKEGESIEF